MTRALVLILALCLALPAAAVAAKAPQTNAPPGNAGIDEYLETVPGASGNHRPTPPGQQGGGGGLTPSQRAKLDRLGPDGRTLANAVDSTSSSATTPKKTQITATGSDGRSPLAELLNTITGSDGGSGMGVLLPGILVAALLAAIVAVLLRRRATS